MAAKKMKFKTETQKLLNLVINSLYSHKEIFLRELVSNASDSLDKLRFMALTDTKLDASTLQLKLIADKDAGTLTVSDSGIGMNEQDLIDNLGTIAKSGTGAFLEALEQNQEHIPELIGQFGVGFYASFMVADHVRVISRKAGEGESWQWESEGTGNFSLGAADSSREHSGTDIILHLKDDCKEYLEEYRLRSIIKKYSDFIEYPVLMDVEKYQDLKEGETEAPKQIEEEALNSQKAIWMRPASEIKEEEYTEFYKHVSHDYNEPFTHIHYRAEGTTEFSALLFLPSQMPFDMMFSDDKAKGVHLYVKRVFITDDSEALMPRYLRFVKGVVDSSDLPLNVSREILQQERALHTIKNNLQKKVLDTLSEKMEKDRKGYEDFFRELGSILKEGLALDFSNREKLLDLMLFQSTQTEAGVYTTLADYLNRMPEGQEDIYFITGESRTEVENSPYLESLKQKKFEVLLLVDTIDEFISQHLGNYKEKKFKSAAHGDISFDKGSEKEKESAESKKQEYSELIKYMEKQLDERVKEIRISRRLVSSPCCLVADSMGMSANMERIMKSMRQDVPDSKRVLEINPDNELISLMNSMAKDKKQQNKLDRITTMLFDQAVIAEGGKVPNPDKFIGAFTELLTEHVKSLN